RSKSLGTGLQRAAHLYDEKLRPIELLLPAGAPGTSLVRRDRPQSHAALHAFGEPRPTSRAGKRLPFSKRLHHSRRSAHGRTNRLTSDRHRYLAIRATIDNPTALQRANAKGPVHGYARRSRREIGGGSRRSSGPVFRRDRSALRFP